MGKMVLLFYFLTTHPVLLDSYDVNALWRHKKGSNGVIYVEMACFVRFSWFP